MRCGWIPIRCDSARQPLEAEDTSFVLFTRDSLLPRPLYGAANLLAGLGETALGLLAVPFDGGHRLMRGAQGLVFSFPELAFVSLRKGNLESARDAVEPATERLRAVTPRDPADGEFDIPAPEAPRWCLSRREASAMPEPRPQPYSRLAAALASALLPALLGCPEMAVLTGARSVIDFNGPVPEELGEAVRARGGKLLDVRPELGVALVTGLSDATLDELVPQIGAKEWARDLLIQMTPGIPDAPTPDRLLPLPAGALADASPGGDPSDATYFDRQWNLHITGISDAFAAGFLSHPDVRIAVLDTGIDPDHVDLEGLIDEQASIAFTPSFVGPPAWADDHWHGTHVAGTIVTNGIGMAGVAPGSTLIAIKVCTLSGRCSTYDVIAGILHAVDVGADVANLSLTGFYQHRFGGFFNSLLQRTVAHANKNGTLVVAAAGNNGVDLQALKDFRAWPCEASTVFCVSATRSDDTLAPYSNHGISAIAIAAPGGDLGTPDFDYWVLGPCNSRSLIVSGCKTGDWYLFARGTSMAAPHASGAAALLRAAEPGINAGVLRARLQQTAVDLGKPGADSSFGKGRVDVCAALGC